MRDGTKVLHLEILSDDGSLIKAELMLPFKVHSCDVSRGLLTRRPIGLWPCFVEPDGRQGLASLHRAGTLYPPSQDKASRPADIRGG